MKRLKAGDRPALAYLYDQYSGALYGMIFRILQHKGMSDEVLQDAFLKIWDRFDQYDPGKGRLFTWMLNLTRNLAIDKTRSREYSQLRKTGDIGDIVHSDTNALVTETATDAIGIQAVLNELDAKQRLIVDYLYFKGFTQSELAEELDMPLGTVKTRLRAAMKELRKKLIRK